MITVIYVFIFYSDYLAAVVFTSKVPLDTVHNTTRRGELVNPFLQKRLSKLQSVCGFIEMNIIIYLIRNEVLESEIVMQECTK